MIKLELQLVAWAVFLIGLLLAILGYGGKIDIHIGRLKITGPLGAVLAVLGASALLARSFSRFCSNRSRRFPPHDASLSPEAREDAKEFGHGVSHRTSQANGEGRDTDFVAGPGNRLRRLDILDVARSPWTRT